MTTKVTVTIPRDTVLDEDESVNTFHFRTLTGGVFQSAQADAVTEALRRFYDVAPPSPAVNRLSLYLATVNAPTLKVKFYQLPLVPPALPYQERSFTITPGGSNLPEEVAACLSYRKTPVTGENPKHRRGRIYLGPLSQSALAQANGRVRVIQGLQDTATQAGKRLQEEIRAIGANFDWIVWSPTTSAEHVIEEIYMDDAFDTMRSRGPKVTARTLVTV